MVTTIWIIVEGAPMRTVDRFLAELALGPLDAGDLRVLFVPAFHPMVCVTLRGGELELVWRAGGDLAVVSRAVERAEIEALPPFPDGEADLAARDGILLHAEAGGRVAFATSPTPGEAPEHHRFFHAVLEMTARHVRDADAAAVLAGVGRYLR